MAEQGVPGWTIDRVTSGSAGDLEAACGLLTEFLAEEGLATPPERIRRNVLGLLEAPLNAVLLARAEDGTPLGVATLTTSHSIEQGRVAELEDLYVVPEMRRNGLGSALVHAAIETARDPIGCETVAVVVTAHGQHDLGMVDFYLSLGFEDLDRKMLLMALQGDGAAS